MPLISQNTINLCMCQWEQRHWGDSFPHPLPEAGRGKGLAGYCELRSTAGRQVFVVDPNS